MYETNNLFDRSIEVSGHLHFRNLDFCTGKINNKNFLTVLLLFEIVLFSFRKVILFDF